jgi:hypothetical protein
MAKLKVEDEGEEVEVAKATGQQWTSVLKFDRFPKTGGYKAVEVLKNGDDVFLAARSSGESEQKQNIVVRLTKAELALLSLVTAKLATE